jgi:hypothetical protein
MRAVSSSNGPRPTRMIAPPVSVLQSAGRAILVSVAPKSVGGAYRIYDDRKAPEKVKRNTVRRELATLGQVAFYSVTLDRAVKQLEAAAITHLKKNPNRLVAGALRKFQQNQAMFLVLLACCSNFIAEAVSRKLAPRDIWEKPPAGFDTHTSKKEDDDDEDDDEKKDTRPARSSYAFTLPSKRTEPLQPLTFANAAQSAGYPPSPFYLAPSQLKEPPFSPARFSVSPRLTVPGPVFSV